jgi:hypothetical protein
VRPKNVPKGNFCGWLKMSRQRTVNPWLRDKRPTVAAQLPLSINSLGLLAQESNSNSFDEKGRQRP